MKAKFFLTTAIFTLCVLLTACSENPIGTSESLIKNSGKTHPNYDQGKFFWNYRDLSVYDNGESYVSNEVTSPSLSGSISKIRITFNAATNSTNFSGLIARLTIFETGDLRPVPASIDDILKYSETDPSNLNGYREVNLDFPDGSVIEGHAIKIVVELIQVDGNAGGNVGDTYLRLNDINIYTYSTTPLQDNSVHNPSVKMPVIVPPSPDSPVHNPPVKMPAFGDPTTEIPLRTTEVPSLTTEVPFRTTAVVPPVQENTVNNPLVKMPLIIPPVEF